jgi:opacity protein-like surface antigen
MNHQNLLLCLLLLVISISANAQDPTLNGSNRYGVHGLSLVYHVVDRSSDLVEGFSNQLSLFSMQLPEQFFLDDIMIGSLLHSGGKRCLVLGGRKNWKYFSDRLSFNGVYAYVGEAPSDIFNDCGDNKIYRDIRDKTSFGAAPYLYHGVEYDLSRNFSIHAGYTVTNILSTNLEYSW